MSARLRSRPSASTSAAISLALSLLASPLAAQSPKTDLIVANATVTFATPTATDFVNGFVDASTGVTFTVDATNGTEPHTTTVLIRSTSANLGNGKVIGDLQWRRSDLLVWNSITLTNAQVDQKLQIRNVLNDPWNNTIFFRMILNWTTDGPATYSANYQITLSQTVP